MLKSVLKGWLGEKAGAIANWLYLPADTYHRLNDVTLMTENGTTQIDHVIVSRYGIFVVEAKNIDGWIFGDERSPHWTQVLHGRKHRFQNPLHQNYRHVMALGSLLGVEPDKLHSVVMFWGDAVFKTPMPPNVLTKGYASYIKSFQSVVFTDDEVRRIVDVIQAGRLQPSLATRHAHIKSLQARFDSTSTCPKCGSALVERQVSRGQRAGQRFLGCASFPRCRYTRELAEK